MTAPAWQPCPFCAAELLPDIEGMEHPDSDTCPLDSIYVSNENREAWNTRVCATLDHEAVTAIVKAGKALRQGYSTCPCDNPLSAQMKRVKAEKWDAALRNNSACGTNTAENVTQTALCDTSDPQDAPAVTVQDFLLTHRKSLIAAATKARHSHACDGQYEAVGSPSGEAAYEAILAEVRAITGGGDE